MRLAAIALLTLIAVGLFFLLSESPGLAPVSSVAASGIPDPVRHEEPMPATSLQEAGPLTEDRTPLKEVTSVELEPQAEASLLQGRVVLTDDSGMELSHVNGAITLILWKGNIGGNEECQVSDGAFELSVEDTERLSVSELLIDGRHAVLDEFGQRFPVDEGPIIVRAHWPKSLVLNVVGQETGAHLSDIALFRGQGWISDTLKHPGRPNSSQKILTDGYSPLELHPSIQESNSPDTLYFVHSPGFAWKAIHLDLSHGGEREIRLEAGGDLEIQVVGGVPQRGATLRLREPDATDSAPYTEVGFRKPGPVEISGLAPGTYRVTAEEGEWFERPPVLGEAEVEIKAGKRAQVELQVEIPLKPVSARLAGNVVVPREWKLSSFQLDAKPDGSAGIGREGRRSMQEMEDLGGQPPMWSFDFGEIPTGPYSLDLSGQGELGEIDYSMGLTLGPGGLEDVHFELPPPATIVVHLLDAATGEPAEVPSIHWGALGPAGRRGAGLTTESPAEGAQHFEFAAPIGKISVGSFGSGYDSLREELQIDPGHNEFTFRLDRECPLTITFLDGQTPVPLADHWYPRPEHLDGEGQLLYISSGASGFKTGLSQPGRYVFEFPDFPDFEPVPSQTITVQRGEATNHVVQLVRKQR